MKAQRVVHKSHIKVAIIMLALFGHPNLGRAQDSCIDIGNACTPCTDPCNDNSNCCEELLNCPPDSSCCVEGDLCCPCEGVSQFPNSSSPLRPLTELDAGTYFGRNRGLYSPASGTMTNTIPEGHKANGLTRGGLIFPRNTSGQFDPVSGFIGVLCIGFSNPTQEFNTFLTNHIESLSPGSLDGLNERLVFINGGFPNHALCEWETVLIQPNHNDNPWGRIVNSAGEINPTEADIRVRQPGQETDQISGLTRFQVQVVWMKNVLPDALKYCEEDANHCCTGCCPADSCSGSCDLCGDADPPASTGCRFPNWVDDGEFPKYVTVLENIQDVFPNVRQVYMSSRTYAGFSNETSSLPLPKPCSSGSPEPFAFENGFTIQKVIQEQIFGSTMPIQSFGWLAWGPYIWSNGERANQVELPYEVLLNALTWPCTKVCADGVHPSRDVDIESCQDGPSGQSEVAQRLLAFFRNDEVSNDWFLDRPFTSLATPTSGTWDRLEDREPYLAPTVYRGITTARFKFDRAVRDANDEQALDTASFEVSCTGTYSGYITAVSSLGNNEYEVTLSAPIPPGQWTTIQALVEADTNEPDLDFGIRTDPWDRIDLGFLPGDVDGNRTTNANDKSELEELLGIPTCNLTTMDINRDGSCTSADVTRLQQLLDGVGTLQEWDGVSLPPRP